MNAVLPVHIAAGGVAMILGAVALTAKKGGRIHRLRRDVLLAVESARPSRVAGVTRLTSRAIP